MKTNKVATSARDDDFDCEDCREEVPGYCCMLQFLNLTPVVWPVRYLDCINFR